MRAVASNKQKKDVLLYHLFGAGSGMVDTGSTTTVARSAGASHLLLLMTVRVFTSNKQKSRRSPALLIFSCLQRVK